LRKAFRAQAGACARPNWNTITQTMRKRRWIGIALVTATAAIAWSVRVAVVHSRDRQVRAKFEALAESPTREQVRRELGEPDEIHVHHKRTDTPMFGPLESVWPQLPLQSEVEEWVYSDSENHYFVYFLRGRTEAIEVASYPKGVVF
jgi:hypothetical protein